MEDERKGAVSLFDGPEPVVSTFADQAHEVAAVAEFIRNLISEGIAPGEIGVFVREAGQAARARAAIDGAGQTALQLSGRLAGEPTRVSIGTMHYAKGLEFKAVVVMGCDEDKLPLRERVEAAGDEVELEDVYETERRLFYVACTRARDLFLVTGVAPGSEFLADLRAG
jgi:superfamily I DNA/RNA helicase